MNAPTQRPEHNALARSEDTPQYVGGHPALTGRDLILNPGNLSAVLSVAGLMAESRQAVAKCLRGNKGACMAVAMQAMRWNMDPFALATKVYTTDDQGPISYEGQAIIAALNNSPLLATRLAFRWEGHWEKIIGKFEWRESKKKEDAEGNPKKYLAATWGDKDEDGLCVVVSALLVGEREPRELRLFMKQARVRNSPLWVEDPRQQLAYLGGRRWGRLHAPDVIMGVYSPDELESFEPPTDMGPADVVGQVPPDLLKRATEAANKGVASYQAFWKACTNLERAQLNELSDEHERLKERSVDADKKRTVDNAPRPTPAPTPLPTAAPATAAAGADPDTGEIAPPQGDAASFVATYASVMDLMVKAPNKIALEIAMEWIQDVKDPAHRDELTAKGAQFMTELKE